MKKRAQLAINLSSWGRVIGVLRTICIPDKVEALRSSSFQTHVPVLRSDTSSPAAHQAFR
jgi:hypothetical protein